MPKTGKNSKGNVFKKKVGAGSADFKKRTAKVGKKVERATVTKISVESKQINVPLQSKISLGDAKDERSVFNKIVKQLRHYNHSNRTQALEDLQNFLLTCQDPESYSSLVVPEGMEKLFDDDADAREALLALMCTITTNVEAKTIEPVMPVLVTYICSGLTSLNKGVRKDSLLLLGQISVTKVAQLLPPFTNKILQNILGLLDKASLIFNSNASNKGKSGGASNTGATTKISSSSQPAMRGGAKGPRPGEITARGASEVAQESHLLLLLLRVVHGLLANSHGEGDEDLNNTYYMTGDTLGGLSDFILPFVALKRVPLFHSALATVDRADAATLGSEGISRSHEKALCEQLSMIWGRLTTEGSNIRNSTVRTLLEAAGAMIRLGSRPNISTACPAFVSLVRLSFIHFPYVSYESGVSSMSQPALEECLQDIKSLNLALCEVALLAAKDALWARQNPKEREEIKGTDLISLLPSLLSVSLSFLLQCLDDLDRAMQEKASAAEAKQSVGDGGAQDGRDLDSHANMDVDVAVPGEESSMAAEANTTASSASSSSREGQGQSAAAPLPRRFEKKGEAFSLSFLLSHRRQDDEQTKTLFRCLKMIVLDRNIRSWYQNSSTTSGPGREVQESGPERILQGLGDLTDSIASFTTKEGSKKQHSQKDIRNVISACIECLARMCIDSVPRFDQATMGGENHDNSVLLGDIFRTLRPLLRAPSLLRLRGWPSDLRAKVTQLFIEALLTVVRRLPSWSIESEINNDKIRFLDEKTGDLLIEMGQGWQSDKGFDFHPLINCLQNDLYAPNFTNTGLSEGSHGSFYSTCTSKQRQYLLHLFALAPFFDFPKVVQALAPQLSRQSHHHLWEQRSFLDTVVRRKRDISPGMLTSVLFAMLEHNSEFTRKGCSDNHDVLHAALHVSGNKEWLGDAVASALLGMSTPSKPLNIVKFLQGKVIEILQKGTRPLDSGKGPVQRQWLGRVYNRNAGAAIVSTLLGPCFAQVGEQDEHSKVHSAVLVTAREILPPVLDSFSQLVAFATASELSEVFSAEIQEGFREEARQGKEISFTPSGLESHYITPLVRLLITKAPSSVATSLGVATFKHNSALFDALVISPMRQYPFLCAYLRYVYDKWAEWGKSIAKLGLYECLAGQLALVQSLERVLRHEACQSATFQCRAFLRVLVAALQTGLVEATNGEQEKESKSHFYTKSVLQDLAEDMK